MSRKLSHIGHLVRDLDAALEMYSTVLGIEPGARGVLELGGADERIRTTVLPVGRNFIEVIEPHSGPLADLLAERGEGIYHLAFAVDDFDGHVQKLTEQGFDLTMKTFLYDGHEQRNAFVATKQTMGAPIELLDAEALRKLNPKKLTAPSE